MLPCNVTSKCILDTKGKFVGMVGLCDSFNFINEEAYLFFATQSQNKNIAEH